MCILVDPGGGGTGRRPGGGGGCEHEVIWPDDTAGAKLGLAEQLPRKAKLAHLLHCRPELGEPERLVVRELDRVAER